MVFMFELSSRPEPRHGTVQLRRGGHIVLLHQKVLQRGGRLAGEATGAKAVLKGALRLCQEIRSLYGLQLLEQQGQDDIPS